MFVVCADIGSVRKGNFAWASSTSATGSRPSELAACVAKALSTGQSVALGFECPLFVPLPESEDELGKARSGEGSRSWSAGAGSGALATGLAQVAWVLARSRSLLQVPARGYLNWEEFNASQPALLVWEAFVSGAGKGANHEDDARKAVQAFQASLPHPAKVTAVPAFSPVQSLAGAALLRAGWSSDLSLLAQACIVIKPNPDAT